MRIVSLLPSATEIICELGLGEQLVGVSHECDYPPFVQDLPKVTRTKIPRSASSQEIDAVVREQLKTEAALYSLDLPTLERLRPELIVTQALCNVCAVAESEVKAAVCNLPGQARVVNLEPVRLADVFASLRLVAEAARAATRGERRRQVTGARRRRREAHGGHRVAPARIFFEWVEPPFCAGHWTPELVRLAGGIELIGREAMPSQTISWEEIVRVGPDVLFVACCGFDAERTRHDLSTLAARPGFNELACVRSGRVYYSDGSAYFNRPGPRLVDSLEILAMLFIRTSIRFRPDCQPPETEWLPTC